MSQRRPPRQTQITRDSWQDARPASSSQSKMRSSSSESEGSDGSDHDLSNIRLELSPPAAGSNKSPRNRTHRLPRTQRRLQSDSEEEEEEVEVEAISPPRRTTRSMQTRSLAGPVPRKTTQTSVARKSEKPSTSSDSDVEFIGMSRSQSPRASAAHKASSSKTPVRTPVKRKAGRSVNRDDTPKKKARETRSRPRRYSPHIDPDEEDTPDAETEDEGVAEIELDEPERFKTATRLRQQKGSTFLQGLQKLKGKRNQQRWPPRGSPSTEEEEDDDHDDDEGDDDEGDDSDASANFIASDDDISDGGVVLPEEFSLKRESPEYKFKVVFQYLVLLVVKGPDILPLKGSEDAYFGRQIHDVRKMMRGLRDSMAGSLWRAEFRKALETYPLWKQANLDEVESYCDACNRRNQKCYQCAWLRGRPYDPETHEDLGDSSSSGSEEDDDDDEDERDLGNMGSLCLKRARDFHELSHWEHMMYLWVRRRYHALLRAKMVLSKKKTSRGTYREPSFDSLASDSSDSEGGLRDRAAARRQNAHLVDVILKQDRRLPLDVYDVDQVTEWMDACGWQKDSMKWLGRVEQRTRSLEGHYK